MKFTDRGDVTVAVARAGDDRLRFRIADTGIGIDDGSRRRLLEPFSQADSSTTRRFGGTGLGLTISAQLVGLLGGELDFESRPGQGSTFWFDVPLPEAAAPTHVPVSSPPSDPAVATVPAGAHVLLADDAHINRLVGVALLERLGCVVDVAANGIEAVDAALRTRYDAILMDCLMPVMDGYEATGRIRGLEGGRHTPIVALTASAMVGDRERCLAAGMDDYLSKPLDRAALAAALARCLAGAVPDRLVG